MNNQNQQPHAMHHAPKAATSPLSQGLHDHHAMQMAHGASLII